MMGTSVTDNWNLLGPQNGVTNIGPLYTAGFRLASTLYRMQLEL